MTETRPLHGKLDHHVSAARKRDGYKQLPVSVEFTKYGNTLFRPVGALGLPVALDFIASDRLNMSHLICFYSPGADPHRFPLFCRNRSDFFTRYIFR